MWFESKLLSLPLTFNDSVTLSTFCNFGVLVSTAFWKHRRCKLATKGLDSTLVRILNDFHKSGEISQTNFDLGLLLKNRKFWQLWFWFPSWPGSRDMGHRCPNSVGLCSHQSWPMRALCLCLWQPLVGTCHKAFFKFSLISLCLPEAISVLLYFCLLCCFSLPRMKSLCGIV